MFIIHDPDRTERERVRELKAKAAELGYKLTCTQHVDGLDLRIRRCGEEL